MTGYYGIRRPEVRPQTSTVLLGRPAISCMPDIQQEQEPTADPGLRRMIVWVAVAFVLTVLVAFAVVEFTLRWFGER